MVADEAAAARAHRFTGLATLGAAAWALDECPVVVYATDDEVAFAVAGTVGERHIPGATCKCIPGSEGAEAPSRSASPGRGEAYRSS